MQRQIVILPDVMSSKSLRCKGKPTPFAGTLPSKCKHKAPLRVGLVGLHRLRVPGLTNSTQPNLGLTHSGCLPVGQTKKYAVVKQGHLVWPSWPMSYGHLAKGRAIYKRLSCLW